VGARPPPAPAFKLLENGNATEAAFSSFKILKILQDFPSYQIFRRMYGALNIGKKLTNCTVYL
jgi:uncharacterized protein YcsI (UPF0317 family)